MGELKDILLNVGAVAGFAAIVGLAVLAMLYFSQARDVRRLREWAGREPERAAEVELRAQQIASQAIAQAYESMALRQSEAQAAAAVAQEQGVEVEEPLVAESFEEAEGEAVAEGEVAYVGEGEEVGQETQAHDVVAEEFGGEEVAEGEAEGEHVEAHEDETEAAEEEHAEQPHEVAAAANGASSDTIVHPAPVAEPAQAGGESAVGDSSSTSRLAPSTPAAARAAAPLPPLPPLDTSEFSAVRPATPPIPDYYLSTGTTGSGAFEAVDPGPERRSRVPFAVAGVLVSIFAVILIATQLVGSDEPATKTPAKKEQTAAGADNRSPQVNRAAVTVSVLNGTETAGLANLAADGLKKAGFTDTTPGNRGDQVNHPTSTVFYASGSKLEAEEVAKELKIKDVKEADDDTLAAGGSVPVIVVLGQDFDQ